MSDFGTGDAQIDVGITADTKAAESQIEAAIGKAFAAALKSPEVKAALAALVKNFDKMGDSLGKQTTKAFDQGLKAGQKFAKQMETAFAKVGASAKDAFDFRSGGKGTPELRTLNAAIEATTRSMDKLELSTKDTLRALEIMTKQASAATRAAAQAERDAVTATTQSQRAVIGDQQLQAARIRATSQERIAIIRAATRQIILLERAIGTAISATFRTATGVVRSFARTATGLIQSFSRSASGSFSAIGRGLSATFRGALGLVRGFTSGATRLLSAFGRTGASAFKGLFSGFKALLNRQESDLRSSLARQRGQINSARSGLQGGLLGRAALVGGGGIGIASFLGGGLERFSNIETLQFRFERLLGSASEASALIKEISDFSRTTSFDLPGVAGLASNFLAMGQSAEDSIVNIKRLADVTAFAGGNTDSLERIQRALGQIISTGKLQGDELNQLAENLPGINIRQIIADQLGVTPQELQKMQEDGALTADTFINAFLTGIDDPRYTGAAVAIAGTLTGRLANLKESFDIFAASIIGAVAGPMGSAMSQITSFLTTVGDFITGKSLQQGEVGDIFQIGVQQLTASQEKLILLREVLGNVAKAAAGLLALKGVFEIFQFGARAARLLLTPMGLLSVAVLGITAAFTLFNRFSDKFASTFKVMKNQIKPAVDALKDLAGAFIGAFQRAGDGEGGGGLAGIITRVGDAFRWVNVWVARVLVGVREFASTFASLLNLRGFENFLGTLDSAIGAGIAGLFALDEDARRQARDEGGSIILNLLEQTFLRPVVQFFRGPFLRVATTVINAIRSFVARIARAVGDFFGDVFSNIFGGDDESVGVLVADQLLGDERAQESIATRLLDNLEDTFLGPVVRFFRGPFADAIEGIGAFVGGLFNAIFNPDEGAENDAVITRIGDFLETTGLKPLVDFLREDGLQKAYDNVKDFFAPTLTSIGDAISAAWDKIGPIVKPLINAIEDVVNAFKEWDFSKMDLGNVAVGAAVGGGAGLLLAGLPGLIIGALGGALSQTGIFAGIVETIGNAWSMAIQPALQNLWNNITGFIAETFTVDNIKSTGEFILDFLYKAGETVGNLATDPYFILPIAAAVGAAVIAAINLALGLLAGLGGSLVQWTNLIADGLEAAWGALDGVLEFIPDPISNAIAAALGSASSGLIAGALGLAIGITLIRSVIGGITAFGPALVQGAGGIVGMMFGKQKLNSQGLPIKAESAFKGIGTKIAGAVIGGIIAYEIGGAAGRTGSAGNIVMSILTGGATGALLGFSIAGPIGAAVGGILGGATAAVGAYFGNAQREADAAAESVRQFADALRDAGITGAASGIVSKILELDQGTRTAFRSLEFDATAFVQDIVDGSETVGSALSDLLFNVQGLPGVLGELDMEDTLNFNRVSRGIENLGNDLTPLLDSLDILRESGGLVGFNGVAAEDFGDFLETLEKGGIDANEFAQIVQFAQDNAIGLTDAMALLGDEQALQVLATDAEGLQGALVTVERAAQDLFDGLKGGGGTNFLRGYLEQSGLNLRDQLEAVEGAADLARQSLDEMRAAAAEALGGVADQSLTDSVRDFQLALEGFGMDGEVQLNVDDIHFQDQLDGLRDQIAGALSEGMSNGTIDSKSEFETFIDGLETGVEESGLSEAAKDALQAMIDEFEAQGALIDWDDIVDADAALLAAEAFGRRLAGGVQTGLSYNQVSEAEDSRFGVLRQGTGTIDRTEFVTQGEEMVGAVQQGVENAQSDLTKALAAVAQAAAEGALDKGASNAAQDAGSQTVQVYAGGITDNESAAVSAGIQMGYGAAAGTSFAIPQMFSAGANLARAMASGIRAQASAAALAAAAMAAAVANAARSALKIQSPSKVFFDIGKQIGQGFVEGIQDSETTMADALSTAISNAIKKATDAGGKAMRDAQAGSAIFGALAPSTLPGGTTTAEILAQRLGLVQGIQGVRGGLQEGAGASLADILGSVDLADARAQVQGLGLGLAEAIASIKGDYADALAAQKEITDFNARQKLLQAQNASGQLGLLRRTRLLSEAYKDLQKEEEQRRDQIAKLGVDLKQGRLTNTEYNSRLAEINAEFNAVELANYRDEVAQINKDYKSGALNIAEYREQIEKLGSRPAALSFEQQNILKSGALSLSVGTLAGQANRESIAGALGDIRSFGQTLLDEGTALPEVIRQMTLYTANLRKQAVAAGFNATQLDQLISAYGLTAAQLTAFRNTVLSLNPATVQGAQNVENILSQLQAIRDFGGALIESGTAAASAVSQMKAFRAQLIAQATAFGFNAAEIQKLVDQVGLSDTALANFLKQMQDFANAANGAPPPGSTPPGSVQQPVVNQTVNLVVPYGDPEAVGLAVANRTAYDLVRLT